jgi:hypothetical protein
MKIEIITTIIVLLIPVLMFVLLFTKKRKVEKDDIEYMMKSKMVLPKKNKIINFKMVKLVLLISLLVSMYLLFTYINNNIDIVTENVRIVTQYIYGCVVLVIVLFFRYINETDINIIFVHSFIIFSFYMIVKTIFTKFSWKSLIISIIFYIILMVAVYILKAFFNTPLHALIMTGGVINDARNSKYRR